MNGGNEQRFAIKFCFTAGLSAIETLALVHRAYGNKALKLLDVICITYRILIVLAITYFLLYFKKITWPVPILKKILTLLLRGGPNFKFLKYV